MSLELPESYQAIDLSAEDFAKIKQTFAKSNPALAKHLDDPRVLAGTLFMAFDLDVSESAFIDNVNVRRLHFPGASKEQMSSPRFLRMLTKGFEREYERLGLLPLGSRRLSFGNARPAIRFENVLRMVGSKGESLRVLSIQYVLPIHPHVWCVTYSTLPARAEAFRRNCERSARSFHLSKDSDPISQPDEEPVPLDKGKLVERKIRKGNWMISLLLPEHYEVLNLSSKDADRTRRRLIVDYPSMATRLDTLERSGILLYAFDPRTMNNMTIDNVNLTKIPIPMTSGDGLTNDKFLENFARPIKKQFKKLKIKLLQEKKLPFGRDFPAIRFDYLSGTRNEDGMRTFGRQYALFIPPNVWLLTYTTTEERADLFKVMCDESAKSFKLYRWPEFDQRTKQDSQSSPTRPGR